jgi:hypothetical protein
MQGSKRLKWAVGGVQRPERVVGVFGTHYCYKGLEILGWDRSPEQVGVGVQRRLERAVVGVHAGMGRCRRSKKAGGKALRSCPKAGGKVVVGVQNLLLDLAPMTGQIHQVNDEGTSGDPDCGRRRDGVARGEASNQDEPKLPMSSKKAAPAGGYTRKNGTYPKHRKSLQAVESGMRRKCCKRALTPSASKGTRRS